MMVDKMTLNYLFFLGILIPTIVTVTLFIVFLVCWYKYRIRQQIMNKRHDPHGRFKNGDEKYMLRAGRIPPPTISSQSSNNNNNIKKVPHSDNYEESPEPTEGFDNPGLYRTAPDSGFSEINDIKCKVVDNSEKLRPNSQASTDSEDSGFRSSRSGQYIHSASSSTAAQTLDNTNSGHMVAMTTGTMEGFPLFKPIKLHPSEPRHPHILSVHGNFGKHVRFPPRKSAALPSIPSHAYTTAGLQQQSRTTVCTDSHRTRIFKDQKVLQDIPLQIGVTTAMIHTAVMEESPLYSVV